VTAEGQRCTFLRTKHHASILTLLLSLLLLLWLCLTLK
jgi:hypothetical protein